VIDADDPKALFYCVGLSGDHRRLIALWNMILGDDDCG